MLSIDFNHTVLDNAEFLKPFAVNLTKNNNDAQDLYQDTLYKALINSDKFSGGTNIKGWLYTIMRNIFINDYRKKSRNKTIIDLSDNQFLLNQNTVASVNNIESNLRVKEILNTIFHLPVIFKKPFLLYFEGYKYQEIADILHEPLGTIKSRIHFARKLLKKKINRY